MLQWAINLSRKDEKLALAQETIQPNEERDVQSMIDTMRDHLVQDFPPEKMERAGNTKTHGVVRAEFIVHDDLPEKLRHGIFARPGRYKAWARFSNPGPHVEPDIDDVGFVSLGLKVMGVEGPKLMDDETGTQDFLAICVPTFPTPDVAANADLQLWSKRELPIWYFLNPRKHHIRDFLMQALWNETQYNPLGHNYYSCVPYLLGEGQAMQYAFFGKSKVHEKIPRVPFRPPDNYLRDNMVKTLLETDVELEMTVQLQTDSYRMPIENAVRAVADEAVAADPGGDASDPAPALRFARAARLRAQPLVQPLALPARAPPARQPEPGEQAHVPDARPVPAEEQPGRAYRADELGAVRVTGPLAARGGGQRPRRGRG